MLGLAILLALIIFWLWSEGAGWLAGLDMRLAPLPAALGLGVGCRQAWVGLGLAILLAGCLSGVSMGLAPLLAALGLGAVCRQALVGLGLTSQLSLLTVWPGSVWSVWTGWLAGLAGLAGLAPLTAALGPLVGSRQACPGWLVVLGLAILLA